MFTVATLLADCCYFHHQFPTFLTEGISEFLVDFLEIQALKVCSLRIVVVLFCPSVVSWGDEKTSVGLCMTCAIKRLFKGTASIGLLILLSVFWDVTYIEIPFE